MVSHNGGRQVIVRLFIYAADRRRHGILAALAAADATIVETACPSPTVLTFSLPFGQAEGGTR